MRRPPSPPRSARALIALAAIAGAALALAGAAQGEVTTVTGPFDARAVGACPGTPTNPCTVVSRTTAMQVEVARVHAPMKVTTAGRIVGWQITLSTPTIPQIRFFDKTEGGPAEAAIAVIHQTKALTYKLVAVSPIVHVQPYFGQTATFALESSIAVRPGDVIALSVPTWVPALELHAGLRTAWRASRSTAQCKDVTTDTAQLTPGSSADFSCLYQTALVHFGAIEISTP